jgi:hypothetical protein
VSPVGQRESRTQRNIIEFFKTALDYKYLGHWKDPEGNNAIEEQYLDDRTAKAIALDQAIRSVKKADWVGNRFKEREVHNAIKSELGDSEDLVEKIFEIVKNQREY